MVMNMAVITYHHYNISDLEGNNSELNDDMAGGFQDMSR